MAAASTRRTAAAGGVRGPFASSTAAAFSARPPTALFHHRSASPTRLHLHPHSSVSMAVDRRPAAVSSPSSSSSSSPRGQAKRTCMCSPTTHPGSFRCSLHKGAAFGGGGSHHQAVSSRLNARRSAMTNSLVRIGTVEGEWVKRALAALIRPSSHQQKRRASFRPRPSRLSVMSKASD